MATPVEGTQGYLGASSDLSRVFVQPETPLLSDDIKGSGGVGIYELELAGPGAGTSEELRLVNVNSKGEELNYLAAPGDIEGALIGDNRQNPKREGSAYQAISESGNTVFFQASPTSGPRAYTMTLYARIDHEKTVTISGAEEGQPEIGVGSAGRLPGRLRRRIEGLLHDRTETPARRYRRKGGSV